MQCECTNILTGGKTSSSVNLSKHLSISGTYRFVKFCIVSADPFSLIDDHITVSEQGWLTC